PDRDRYRHLSRPRARARGGARPRPKRVVLPRARRLAEDGRTDRPRRAGPRVLGASARHRPKRPARRVASPRRRALAGRRRLATRTHRRARADSRATMRPPTWIEPGRLIAGRHPCAAGPERATVAVNDLVAAGVTLFVDLTEEGEL